MFVHVTARDCVPRFGVKSWWEGNHALRGEGIGPSPSDETAFFGDEGALRKPPLRSLGVLEHVSDQVLLRRLLNASWSFELLDAVAVSKTIARRL